MSTTELLYLRCSALPRALLCPGSVRQPEVRVDVVSDPGLLGTAVHRWLARVVNGEQLDLDDITDTDTRVLVALGIRVWGQVWQSFPEPRSEVYRERAFASRGFALTGSCDIDGLAGSEVRIGDWKSSRLDGDYLAQLRGYMLLAVLESDAATATGTVLWLRDQAAENYTETRESLLAFADAIRDRVVHWDGVFTPGNHCAFCPRAHECEARIAHERAIVAIFTDERAMMRKSIAELSSQQQLELYARASLVARLSAAAKDALYTLVRDSGPIVANGRRLDLVPQHRSVIKPLEAWPILESLGAGDSDLAGMITVHKARLHEWLRAKAGRGKGAAAIRDAMAKLKSANALATTERLVLREGRYNGDSE